MNSLLKRNLNLHPAKYNRKDTDIVYFCAERTAIRNLIPEHGLTIDNQSMVEEVKRRRY
jgi:hypothetical protein